MGRRNNYNQNRPRRSYFRTSDVVFLVITTCIVSLNMALLLFFTVFQNNPTQPVTNSKALNDFIKEYNTIKQNYYGEINEEDLMKAALEGLINALPDKNSNSIDNTESNTFETYLQGQYEGVGIEIVSTEEGNIVIYNIIENSPASLVDIKKGDILVSLNGKNMFGVGTTEVVDMIKTYSGTFNLVLEREGKEISVRLKKAMIELKSVKSEVIESGNKSIGYMKVSIFASNTNTQFRKNLETLEQNGIDGLIIDLRGNTGGYLSSVTDMLSIFIDKKDAIYQIKDSKKTQKIYSSEPGVKIYAIVVLIDGGSASASEIMAAALNEQLGTPLIGTKTYGKGSVQELINSSIGTQYKYTTKAWLTPKGKSIEGVGVTPTTELNLSADYYANPIRANDNQLQAGLNYFTNK